MTACSEVTVTAALTAALVAASACASSVRQFPGRGPEAISVELASVERRMLAAALDTIAAHLPDSTSLCVTLMGGPEGPASPDDAFLADLRIRQRAVRQADCPPTYARMVRLVDSLGRSLDPTPPPGYIDPYRLVVGRPQFVTRDYAWIHVREEQGLGGHAHLCSAQVYSGRVWAYCRMVESWVH